MSQQSNFDNIKNINPNSEHNSLTIGSFKTASLLSIQCITSLHVGSGRSSSVVDLPIQKDSLGYPVIFSSSLKGAIREGSENEIYGNGDFAGSFSPLDAKLLFIPVRSLFGVYCLATSPLLLNNLIQYLDFCHDDNNIKEELIQLIEKITTKYGDLTDSIFITSNEGKKLFGDSFSTSNNNNNSGNVSTDVKSYAILAEEFRLEIMEDEDLLKLAALLKIQEKYRIIMISDDLLRNSINRSLITNARIRIDEKSGTTKQHGLWTEESLPEKTIMFTAFFYSESRGKSQFSSIEVQKIIESKLIDSYKIFGGHESTGKGIARITRLI